MYNYSYHTSSPSGTVGYSHGLPSSNVSSTSFSKSTLSPSSTNGTVSVPPDYRNLSGRTNGVSTTSSMLPPLTRDQQWEARRAQYYRAKSLGYKQGIQPPPQYNTYVPYKINYTNVKNNIIDEYNQTLVQQGQSPRPLYTNSYSNSYTPDMVQQMQRIGASNGNTFGNGISVTGTNHNGILPSGNANPTYYPITNPPPPSSTNTVPDALDFHMVHQQQQQWQQPSQGSSTSNAIVPAKVTNNSSLGDPSSTVPSLSTSFGSHYQGVNYNSTILPSTDPSLNSSYPVRSRDDILRMKQAARLQNNQQSMVNNGTLSNVGSTVIGNTFVRDGVPSIVSSGSNSNSQNVQYNPPQQMQQQQYHQVPHASSSTSSWSTSNNHPSNQYYAVQSSSYTSGNRDGRNSRQLLQPPGGNSSFSFG